MAELFNFAGVPCKISSNIEADLWTKMVMNCAGNAVTAIAQTSHGHAARNPYTRQLMTHIIEETVAVARSSGVRLPAMDLVEMGLKLATALGDATSSTAQDLARGKRTEIDSLNGYIVRRGAAHAGINWHVARPPVRDLEFEVDCRSVRVEEVL